MFIFFFQAEDGIRDIGVTGVQTCALPISLGLRPDVALDLLAGGGVERDLARGEDEAVGLDRLRVRPDRLGCLLRGYDLFGHRSSLSLCAVCAVRLPVAGLPVRRILAE